MRKWQQSEALFGAAGPSSAKPFPFRLGLIADLGQTANSSTTVQHLQASNSQIFTLIGGASAVSLCTASSPCL